MLRAVGGREPALIVEEVAYGQGRVIGESEGSGAGFIDVGNARGDVKQASEVAWIDSGKIEWLESRRGSAENGPIQKKQSVLDMGDSCTLR